MKRLREKNNNKNSTSRKQRRKRIAMIKKTRMSLFCFWGTLSVPIKARKMTRNQTRICSNHSTQKSTSAQAKNTLTIPYLSRLRTPMQPIKRKIETYQLILIIYIHEWCMKSWIYWNRKVVWIRTISWTSSKNLKMWTQKRMWASFRIAIIRSMRSIVLRLCRIL